jgi:uncharacterized protein
MKSREHEPTRLDVEAFAKAGVSMQGQWPLTSLERLAESAAGDAPPGPGDEVAWEARGELRAVRGQPSQVWLHVSASTELALQCQRCLQPVDQKLAIERSFLFVHGEDQAAALDTDSEDDVLALTRALDLRELLEDELLLALPLVPRHDQCPAPLVVPSSAGAEQADEETPHPFAALAALKKTGPPAGH